MSEATKMAQRMFENNLAANPVDWNSPSPEKRAKYLESLISSYLKSAKFFLDQTGYVEKPHRHE